MSKKKKNESQGKEIHLVREIGLNGTTYAICGRIYIVNAAQHTTRIRGRETCGNCRRIEAQQGERIRRSL